ncbi:uncharacterized protein LOC127286251 [Leptopilina boulardi]|uniref:uncharacterized protein LOC127286251 n=1 Tax=Leptopilina boulardi TaxID=63433 RepID=UPI0021F644D6|nr:uncharacterized protein LOC127286251 [Leptopilina boulardi]
MEKTIPRNRLQFLAEQIIHLFLTEEVTTYFEAYRHIKTKKLTAKGKLVWKYYNLRRKLSNCGAISKLKPSSSDHEIPLTEVECTKSIAGSLCWLEQNRGTKSNWSQVVDHWQRTSKIRLYRLIHGEDIDDEMNSAAEAGDETSKTAAAKKSQKTKQRPTLYDYKVKYPVFQENRAYELKSI